MKYKLTSPFRELNFPSKERTADLFSSVLSEHYLYIPVFLHEDIIIKVFTTQVHAL